MQICTIDFFQIDAAIFQWAQ